MLLELTHHINTYVCSDSYQWIHIRQCCQVLTTTELPHTQALHWDGFALCRGKKSCMAQFWIGAHTLFSQPMPASQL